MADKSNAPSQAADRAQSASPSDSESSDSSPPSTPDTVPQQTQPPIITYPEFLARPLQRPPLLLTARRLLTTLYIAGTAAATVYGASKYVVSPLIESLTEARHSFAEHTLTNIERLNSKLEKTVWEIPPSCRKNGGGDRKDERRGEQGELGESDALSSADSDPTELFHVDAGTQTTPDLFQRPSRASEDIDTPIHEGASRKGISSQQFMLNMLQSKLTELESVTESAEDADVVEGLQELTVYLVNLAHKSPYYGGSGYTYAGMVGRYGGAAGGRGTANSDDAIAKVKSEIRSIKGALLSARSFPAAVT